MLNRLQKLMLFSAALLLVTAPYVSAETTIDALTQQIDDHQSQVDQLNKRMDEYKKKLSSYSGESASLTNDVAMIENQIELSKLDIEATRQAIEAQHIKLQILDADLQTQSAKLSTQRSMLKEMLFALHTHHNRVGLVAAMFSSKNFDELFSDLEQLESLNSDLNDTLSDTEATKEYLEETQAQEADDLDELQQMESDLKEKLSLLEESEGAKLTLLNETQSSETQYRVLMSELRQEQQYINSQVAKLQNELESKISDSDELGDSTIITWPVVDPIITARFHDPSYPYRNLFEHSGLDMAVPVGTSVTAAAPGYVAWARAGRSYGNYIMIIHSNGLATLYAHLSRIDVKEDQFVTRGQQIALSGGRAGAPGSGLSTGPHLHFEVRVNGVPNNPANFLVDR